MLEKGTRLWFINNKTGKIDSIVVSRAGRQNFSFLSRGRSYRAEYSTIGTKYFRTQDALLESQRKRAELKTLDELPEEPELEDIIIVCCDCKKNFKFSVAEQEFYAEKQFTQPVRCRVCRCKRKSHSD